MHAVTVELDFVQPLVAFRRRLDQLRELWRDPIRQRGRKMRRGRATVRAMTAGEHAGRPRLRALEAERGGERDGAYGGGDEAFGRRSKK